MYIYTYLCAYIEKSNVLVFIMCTEAFLIHVSIYPTVIEHLFLTLDHVSVYPTVIEHLQCIQCWYTKT